MAEIFRPTYTTVDPATGERTRKKSKRWWIRYYSPDGRRHKVKGYPDRKATEQKAAELERRAVREVVGLADPMDQHAQRPLLEHVAEFRAYLDSKRNTPSYVEMTCFRLAAVLDGCGFVRIRDIDPGPALEFLAGLRKSGNDAAGNRVAGKSIKTANEYLAAAKSFTRWLVLQKRATADPLACLARFKDRETDIRHARRDLTPEELGRLLAAAKLSPKSIRNLTGEDRYFLYLAACATGFRAQELGSLTPESFALEGRPATVRVKSSCTKNRKEAVQPLPADVAEALRGYLNKKPTEQPVWPGRWSAGKAFTLMQADLAKARELWIREAFTNPAEKMARTASDFLAYRDRDGRYADFHALRHTYLTMLGKLGLSPREHQDLARHSTFAMTARYTHTRLTELGDAVQALALPKDALPAAVAATGTDGGGEKLGPNLGPQGQDSPVFSGQGRSQKRKQNPGKQGLSAVPQGSEEMEAAGIEPASRGTSAQASTCVACLGGRRGDPFAVRLPSKRSHPTANQPCFSRRRRWCGHEPPG